MRHTDIYSMWWCVANITITVCSYKTGYSSSSCNVRIQEAQLTQSQRGRAQRIAMLRVIEYFAKSLDSRLLKVIGNDILHYSVSLASLFQCRPNSAYMSVCRTVSETFSVKWRDLEIWGGFKMHTSSVELFS